MIKTAMSLKNNELDFRDKHEKENEVSRGMYNNERCLIFDESGNMGVSGRYFVISCIDTKNAKSLHNIMKRKLKQAGDMFPELKTLHVHEIKAKDAYPCVKYHLLECIMSKELSVSYIVIDLKHIEDRLLKDKNILYNFAAKILISKLITKEDEGTIVNILFDNKTTKIASKNSLREYIIAYLVYEQGLDIAINFEYKDSDAGDAFIIQAADYIANALYCKYEYDNDIYVKLIEKKINKKQHFPYKNFGK
ncbi:MAG: DUF3800 domain-containing protein [Lachnospiraceae bacterium]|nr:DUF3800 domain-containing protein [Lachnospiraceae bacterium]